MDRYRAWIALECYIWMCNDVYRRTCARFLNRVPGFDSRRGYHRLKASECGAPIIDDRRSVLDANFGIEQHCA
jgi:hypothetical protein